MLVEARALSLALDIRSVAFVEEDIAFDLINNYLCSPSTMEEKRKTHDKRNQCAYRENLTRKNILKRFSFFLSFDDDDEKKEQSAPFNVFPPFVLLLSSAFAKARLTIHLCALSCQQTRFLLHL